MAHEVWTDPLLSFLGAAGVLAYAAHIHAERTRSGFERMMLVLLYCLAALFVTRGLNWLTDDPRVEVPLFLPATLLPLAVTLFIEALMRRHVPPALKLFVAVGTAVGFVLNLVPVVDRDVMWTITRVVTLVTLAWLGLIVVRRSRAAHSPMENRLIDGFAVALGFAFLFAITDMQLGPEWLDFRLGGLGGLIFVYVCARLTDPGESTAVLLRELAGITVAALGLAGLLGLLLPDAGGRLRTAVFLVSLAFLLLFTIVLRLGGLRRRSRRSSFFRWLLDAEVGSVEELVTALDRLPLAAEHLVLRGPELSGFEPEVMARAFGPGRAVWTLSGLRSELDRDGVDRDPAERLVGLLERNGMTHVALLCGRPPVFLLLHLPQVAGGHNPMLEVALLQKVASLMRPTSAGSLP